MEFQGIFTMDWIPAKLGSGFYLLDSDELDQSESIGLASEFQSGKLISWIPDCGFPLVTWGDICSRFLAASPPEKTSGTQGTSPRKTNTVALD